MSKKIIFILLFIGLLVVSGFIFQNKTNDTDVCVFNVTQNRDNLLTDMILYDNGTHSFQEEKLDYMRDLRTRCKNIYSDVTSEPNTKDSSHGIRVLYCELENKYLVLKVSGVAGIIYFLVDENPCPQAIS